MKQNKILAVKWQSFCPQKCGAIANLHKACWAQNSPCIHNLTLVGRGTLEGMSIKSLICCAD
jgi:hypothetical protein